MKILINADDFGINSEANKGVILAFKLGIIDSASIVANSPFFEEACELVQASHLEDRIGIHFNITEGSPLSSRMSKNGLFCSKQGRLIYSRNKKIILTQSEMDAVASECEDQILRFHSRGIYPKHLDSHNHVHTEWFIFRAIEPIIKKHGIISVRIAENIAHCALPKKAYKKIFNTNLKRRNFISVDYFSDFAVLLKNAEASFAQNSVIEVMSHPFLDNKNCLIDSFSGNELIMPLKKIREMNHSNREYEIANVTV